MELKTFLQLLRKNVFSISVSGIVIAAAVMLFSMRISDSYVSMLSVYVQKIPEQTKLGDYTYDGFYVQQAAESYTDTVVGLFESPAILSSALEKAGESAEASDVKAFGRKITVTKAAPRLIDIEVKDVSRDESTLLVKSLVEAVQSRVVGLNDQQNSGLDMQIDVVNPDPLVNLIQPLLWLNTLIGFLIGLFISTSIVVLKDYLLH
ncbi:hypothetical protein KC571_01870 [candidate division WWE3 bacterium]|uniref:Polysaccharide chain length determinant N-terminal domain-containing protein n=1 Tax=candidate division WWE3 bacterium TaxID=2053526 RepID=A0A955LGF4_UNCKA|nr:hypothetical protein [candidate division WWE3 bacterium]